MRVICTSGSVGARVSHHPGRPGPDYPTYFGLFILHSRCKSRAFEGIVFPPRQ